MEKLLAFHSDPKLKSAMLKEIRWHMAQDKLIKGTYGAETTNGDFKGCAIACSIHSLARIQKKKLDTSDHMLLQSELGVPVALAYLEDRIFEGLPADLAMTWPKRFLKAIKPGADLSLVFDKMMLWVFLEHQKLLKEEYRPTLDGIIGLWKIRAAGELPTRAKCEAVAKKLRADLADRADRADLAYRAYRADRADLADLAYLAYRADRAYRAYRADRAYLYTKQSEKLLELLSEAPITKQ